MKIIDKTPLLNEKGELAVMQRVQGMLKYGFNWPTELEAQKAIITFFDRNLEKGYTLIRNITLGSSPTRAKRLTNSQLSTLNSSCHSHLSLP